MMPDPALRGLDDRDPGSPCPTLCAPDCQATCHERHNPHPAHDQFYCDQIRLGRDVSEYRREIRLEAASRLVRPERDRPVKWGEQRDMMRSRGIAGRL